MPEYVAITNFVCKDMKTVILVESGAEGASSGKGGFSFYFFFFVLFELF